eukprot:9497640-Pyramimonas_sp.AAC.1
MRLRRWRSRACRRSHATSAPHQHPCGAPPALSTRPAPPRGSGLGRCDTIITLHTLLTSQQGDTFVSVRSGPHLAGSNEAGQLGALALLLGLFRPRQLLPPRPCRLAPALLAVQPRTRPRPHLLTRPVTSQHAQSHLNTPSHSSTLPVTAQHAQSQLNAPCRALARTRSASSSISGVVSSACMRSSMAAARASASHLAARVRARRSSSEDQSAQSSPGVWGSASAAAVTVAHSAPRAACRRRNSCTCARPQIPHNHK